MKRFIIYSLILAALCLAAFKKPKPKILVYTKNGKGYVHANIPFSIKAIQKLGQENGFEVDASEDPSIFTRDQLKQYQLIIFSNTNNEAFDNNQQRLEFMRYIQAGGAFVGIHSACGSERNWPWFQQMVGGKFLRHPKYQPFTLKVIDPDHPSTSFLGSEWNWEDECYYMNHLNPDIQVLLAADLTTVDDEKRAEYPGVTFGDLFPSAWYHHYDGGWQWYTSLGHDSTHYSDPKFLKHLLGGIQWALEKSQIDYSKASANELSVQLQQ